jgi:hypothetical protein
LRRRGESAGAGLEQGSLFAYLLFLILFPLAMGGRSFGHSRWRWGAAG